MLVLTRSREEKVVIQTPQGDVVITVLAFRGDSSVKLGFTAPREVLIHRSEILAPRPAWTPDNPRPDNPALCRCGASAADPYCYCGA